MIARTCHRILWAILLVGLFLLAARMALGGAPALGAALAAAGLGAAWIYLSPRTHASRYLLPGLAAFAVFVLMPLLYTVYFNLIILPTIHADQK